MEPAFARGSQAMSEQKPADAAAQQKQDEVPWWRNHPWMGHHVFVENSNKNCEMLLQYEGKWVAWLPDGSGIFDADVDPIALVERIKASGEDPAWYHLEYATSE